MGGYNSFFIPSPLMEEHNPQNSSPLKGEDKGGGEIQKSLITPYV